METEDNMPPVANDALIEPNQSLRHYKEILGDSLSDTQIFHLDHHGQIRVLAALGKLEAMHKNRNLSDEEEEKIHLDAYASVKTLTEHKTLTQMELMVLNHSGRDI